MTEVVHRFKGYDNTRWLHKPMVYWAKNIHNGRPENYTHKNFNKWLRETYNVEFRFGVHHFVNRPAIKIVADSEADWLRFYLEWAD